MAHEALIRGWDRLRKWIDADRTGLRIHHQLTEAAQGWEANRRESTFLYEGTRLAVAQEWREAHRGDSTLEADFLDASRDKRIRGILVPSPGPGDNDISLRRLVLDRVAKRSAKKETTRSFLFAFYENVGRKPDDAITHLKEAIELDPTYSEAHLFLGTIYANKRDYNQAIAKFTKAIDLDPEGVAFVWALFYRGDAYRDTREYDRAIEDYDKAIRLDSKFDWAYNNRGDVRRYKGEYYQAILDYTEAIRLNDNLVYAYNNRGDAYRDTKEYDRAIVTTTRRSASTPISSGRTRTAVMSGDTRGSTARRSRTTPRRSASTPISSMHTTAAATPIAIRRSTTGRSATTPRRSASTPISSGRTKTAVMSGDTRGSTARRSRTTPRRSASAPISSMHTTAAATPIAKRRSTTRRWRLHPGDPPRPQSFLGI